MKRSLFLVSAFVSLMWSGSVWANCNHSGSLVPNLDPQKSAGCIAFILHDLAGKNQLDKKRIHEFIVDVLDADMDSLAFMHDDISSIISLFKSSELMNVYADYIIKLNGFKSQTTQVRQEALAKLFVLEAPLLLEVIHSRNRSDQDILIDHLSFGIESFFYPHINQKNFRRKMVGEHWELLKSPVYPIVQNKIETSIRGVITGERNRLYNK